MDYLDQLYDNIVKNPILAGLATIGINSIIITIFNKIKNFFVPSYINGYWITKFKPKNIKGKDNIEIYNFKRKKIVGRNNEQIVFKLQHFNNIFKAKAVLANGNATFKLDKLVGVYFIKNNDFEIGSIMLRVDTSFKGKCSTRLVGTYSEFEDNKILKTFDDDYILYKIKLPLIAKIKFIFDMKCFKNYDALLSFYKNHINNFNELDRIIEESNQQ